MKCWWLNNGKSRAQHPKRMQVDLSSGRNMKKQHVRGRIVARANVGFEEEDWRFLVFTSAGGWTTSDIIREAVRSARKSCEADTFGFPEDVPPWMVDGWDK